MKETNYYSEDFWFNELQNHGIDAYDENYWAYIMFKEIVCKITDIPDSGSIVVLGTNNCLSFDLLCKHFGYDRCIGYDIANPSNHPNVKVMNVLDLNEDYPIAFCYNDIGNFELTPLAKLHAQQWGAKNIIEGGYFLGKNNLNSAKFPLEEHMERFGFLNTQLLTLTGIFDLSKLAYREQEGHMISKKLGIRKYF
jgi:hypothetical protein